MARRKRTEMPEQVTERDLEFEGHGYVTFLFAREPGDAETDAKEALILAKAEKVGRLPVAKRDEEMRALLADLGLLDVADRHNAYRARQHARWAG